MMGRPQNGRVPVHPEAAPTKGRNLYDEVQKYYLVLLYEIICYVLLSFRPSGVTQEEGHHRISTTLFLPEGSLLLAQGFLFLRRFSFSPKVLLKRFYKPAGLRLFVFCPSWAALRAAAAKYCSEANVQTPLLWQAKGARATCTLKGFSSAANQNWLPCLAILPSVQQCHCCGAVLHDVKYVSPLRATAV